ncbi:MAG: MBOAT family protein [Chloroflexi bacterium]|nr:MBOAT family protein [Chloroflexota bacterium]
MSISTTSFATFVVLVFIVFHLIPTKFKKYWLLFTSLVFYSTWAWEFTLIITILSLVNFFIGKILGASSSVRPWWLRAGIVINVFALLVFKYTDYFLPNLTSFIEALGIQTNAGGLQILLPVGLSFFVIQAISYLVDVKRQRMPAEEDLVNFTLYLVYFPKMISGPIERAKTFIPKLTHPQVVDNQLLTRSFSLIILGVIRKVVIADTLTSTIPENVFVNPWDFAGQFLFIWIIVYAFSLYNDFAGYTSIIRGVSGLFGIELSSNFMRPYFSRNFSEFWKRWHISLSEWLRDYIFFPTTRTLLRIFPNRQHVINLILPPMVTMLVSGLWHGISWHMLLWGGLHGVFQVVERLFSIFRPAKADESSKWGRNLAALFVFSLSVAAWIPFRMELEVAVKYVKGFLGYSFWELPNPGVSIQIERLITGKGLVEWQQWLFPDLRIPIILIPALWLDWVQERHQDELVFLRWKKWRQAFILAIAIFVLMLVSGANNQTPFIYQGF